MKKYLSFFSMRIRAGLQYRSAVAGAVFTQLPWGMMECLAYQTFQEADPGAFPMELSAVTAYMWLKEAFFVLFTVWGNTDQEIFDMILKGDIAYELCRPVSIYHMWFAKVSAGRIASASLRCIPILVFASLLPEPFRFTLPEDVPCGIFFVISMCLGIGVTVSFCMIVYVLAFFTISPNGLRMFFMSAVEFLSGSVIPIPFMPDAARKLMELLPFAGMMNAPFRIYSGDLTGVFLYRALGLQIFWLAVMVTAGRLLCKKAEQRIVIQGG